MPQQRIFVDISNERVQRALQGTEYHGCTEMDLDVLYNLLASCSSSRNRKGGDETNSCAPPSSSCSTRGSRTGSAPLLLQDKQERESDKGAVVPPEHDETCAATIDPRVVPDGDHHEEKTPPEDPSALLASDIMQFCQIIRREQVRSEAEMLAGLSEIEILRLKQEERQYQRSVANVTTQGVTTARGEIRAASEGVAMAGHFVLSFLGAFLCGYYFCELFIVDEIAMKALVGGACSFATLLLEAVLFLIREQKQERNRRTVEGRARDRPFYSRPAPRTPAVTQAPGAPAPGVSACDVTTETEQKGKNEEVPETTMITASDAALADAGPGRGGDDVEGEDSDGAGVRRRNLK